MKMSSAKTLLCTLLVAIVAPAFSAEEPGMSGMMNNGMMGGGMMMIAWLLLGVLLIVFLVLAIVALIRYLRAK